MFYLFIADGTEEVEAIATLDVLRRAKIEVKTVAVGTQCPVCSHGLCVKCDLNESEIKLDSGLQGVILPGGMPGTINLENSKSVQSALDFCSKNDLYICAICAAPSVLGHKGLLNGKKAVCFPGFENELTGAEVCSECFAVADGKTVTGKGMGAAIAFALEIVACVKGRAFSDELKATLQCP